jgi:2-keto-4-pentenoate hydratase/2-oxohepta-3-ene-1,7-dioic acid hydratase in catechol pathway
MTDFSLVRFETAQGARAGLLVNGRVFDVAEETGRRQWASMNAILAAVPLATAVLERIAEHPTTEGFSLSSASLLPPVEDPSAIFCAGVNYKDHAVAMAKAHGVPVSPDPRELGLNPWFFIKTAHALLAPDASVPLSAERLDWEAELAVVIGRPARQVPVERALEHVGAYTIANDLSARDRSTRPKIRDGSPFKFDWVAHKNFAGACPLGTGLVPASKVGNPQNLAIRLWVNGELKQDSSTAQMIFSVAEQIAFLSSLITLRTGDVILTGTPAGTGVESNSFLRRADTVSVEIEKLGRLVTHIA